MYPIFINNSDGLNLINLGLLNGYSLNNGGAILNNGILRLSSVTFENNHEGSVPKAFTNNGTIYMLEGGGIFIKE